MNFSVGNKGKLVLKRFLSCTSPSFARCDDDDDTEKNTTTPASDEGMSLIEQADAAIERRKSSIKTPMTFEDIGRTCQGGMLDTYDGLRLIYQKQLNLNTVTNHFWQLGSQGSIYQYRFILLEDEKMLNVATDMDFNTSGELKWPLAENLLLKSSFGLSDQRGNTAQGALYFTGKSSQLSLECAHAANTAWSTSYVQSLTSSLQLGGDMTYVPGKGKVTASVGGVYDDQTNLLAFLWNQDLHIRYQCKVNPNRTHLATDIQFEDNYSKAKCTVGAEYYLKQSTLNFSVDSDFVVKSTLESDVQGLGKLLLSGEAHQGAETAFRFGYGLLFI